MVKVKKTKKVKEEAKAKVTETKVANNEFTFVSRDNSKKVQMSSPMEKNKASEVLFEVLNSGPMPKDLKLQWADSYLGHFINRRGKNACGANKHKDILVINGIADELEALGVKGIVRPETSKNYKAIRLTKMSSEEISDLVGHIKTVLGFTGKKKVKESTGEAVPDAT